MGDILMKKKKTIKEKVLKDIFFIWDTKGVEFARLELKKMFMADYPLLEDHEIEEKRLILHNLAVAEKDSDKGSKESIKKYTKILKEDMEKSPNYIEENGCMYARVLANYAESNKSELTKKQLIDIYKYCYDIYEKIDDTNENGYLAKLVAQFNLSLAEENFSLVLNIIRDVLHNKDSQYESILNQFIENVKEVNENVYNQVLLLLQQDSQIKVS